MKLVVELEETPDLRDEGEIISEPKIRAIADLWKIFLSFTHLNLVRYW